MLFSPKNIAPHVWLELISLFIPLTGTVTAILLQ